MKQKYEYLIVRQHDWRDTQKKMDEKAKEGWEALNLTSFYSSDIDEEVFSVLMRREKK